MNDSAPYQHPSGRRRRVLVIIVAAVLIIAAALSYYVLTKRPSAGRTAVTKATADTRSDIAKQATALAYSQVGAKDVDGAVKTLDQAIAQSSGRTADLSTLYLAKANILASAKRTDQAAATYNQAIALDPNNYGLYEGLGTVYEIAGQKDNARAAYQKALAVAKTLKPGTGHNAYETAVQEAQGFLTRLDHE